MKTSIRRIHFIKLKIFPFLSFFILFGLIMQSGGGFLRNSAIGLLFLFVFVYISLKEIKISKVFIVLYLFITASISISAIVSATQNISLGSIIAFNFSMYLLLFLYFAALKNIITINGYVKASMIFSFIIILITIATFLNISQIETIKPKLIKTFNGLWGQKAFGPVIIWIIYFQGTLALIPACIYCLYLRKYFSFFIVFLGILFSGSRFGLLVVFLFYFLFNIKKVFRVLVVFGLFILIGKFFDNPVINSLFSMFNDSDGGISIRAGHLKGIVELFYQMPFYLISGQGPGSSFYSYGFNGFTDSCEISQFDFMRKYGLLFSIIIFTFLFVFSYLMIKNTDKKGKAMAYAIIAHFVLSISNPVLTSLPFMSFLAISCAYYNSFRKRREVSNAKENMRNDYSV